jgi:hypothetical protein
MAMEIADVLIPEAILTVTGRVMVSPTAHDEELNEPIVVVMFWAKPCKTSMVTRKKALKNFRSSCRLALFFIFW